MALASFMGISSLIICLFVMPGNQAPSVESNLGGFKPDNLLLKNKPVLSFVLASKFEIKLRDAG